MMKWKTPSTTDRGIRRRRTRPLWLTGAILLLLGPGAWAHHPHDVIDAVCLSPSFSRDGVMFVGSLGSINLFLISRNGGYSWTTTRSGLYGVSISDVETASDWETSGIAYVALGPGGLQRTRDGARTWEPPLQTANVQHLALAPAGPEGRQTLFFGGRDRLWRSDDGGVTAALIDPASYTQGWIQALAVSPTYDVDRAVAVATKTKNLSVSRDGGNTWTTVALDALPTSIRFSPAFAEDGTLWVGTWGRGLLCSTDGGATFAEVMRGVEDRDVNDVVVSPTWPRNRDVFAATRDDGVYRSQDGGRSWTLTSLAVPKTFQTNNHHLHLSLPADYPECGTVVCGTFEGLYVSSDHGTTWWKSCINPTRMGRKVAVSPDYANDDNVFMSGYGMQLMASEDGGETWEQRCSDVYALSGYALSVSPRFREDGLIILGVDRGLRRSTDRGRTWESHELEPHTLREVESSYEIRDVAFSPDFGNDRLVFALSKGGLFRSDDAGVTWTSSAPMSPFAAVLEFSPDFARDRTLFLAGHTLHRSTDEGKDWSDPLLSENVLDVRCAKDFAATGEVYLVSQNRGFAYSTDRGLTYRFVKDALEGFTPQGLQLSPAFAADGTLFVTTVGGGVFRSNDRGRSFARTAPLGSPVDDAVSFVISPDFPRDQTLFIGNFDGIWRSRDAGRTWELKTDRELYDDGRQPWVALGEGWKSPRIPQTINRGISLSGNAGDLITLPFTGTGVTLWGTKGPDHGIAEIVLDQQVVKTVDCYDPTPQTQVVLYEDMNLPWGFHTLSVRVTGEKSDASSKALVGVDAAMVAYRGPPDRAPVFASLEEIAARTSTLPGLPGTAHGNPLSGLQWIILPVIVLVVLQLLFMTLRKAAS